MSKKAKNDNPTNSKGLKGVQSKLITTMVALVVIPLTIAIIISYVSSINKALADAEDNNLKQAKIIESEFMTVINQQFRTLEAIANNPYTIGNP